MSTTAGARPQTKPVPSYAALSAGALLEPWHYEPGPLGATEVDLNVTHCGVCHTDAHLVSNDFGISTYPLVPGHEVIGTVARVGKDVRHLAPGQRVGVGWQRGSCGKCEWCAGEQENLCAGSLPTCLAGYGGFAESLRANARFVIPIPEGLSSESAAPMLCAGITVYGALIRFARKGMRVGVIGIGGLGHLALQFARAMQTEVVAFSTTAAKQDDAIRFGAHHFVLSTDPEAFKRVAGSLDLILSTVTADLDWASWLSVLRPNGTFCVLGASPGPIALPVLPMIFGQYQFTASVIGSPARISDMLRFASDNHVQTAVETLPMDQVNEGLDRVRTNQARYRMVLTC